MRKQRFAVFFQPIHQFIDRICFGVIDVFEGQVLPFKDAGEAFAEFIHVAELTHLNGFFLIFVTVDRCDPALGGAEFRVFQAGFFQLIQIPVIRENDDGAVTDLEIFRADLRTFVRYIFDLTAESLRFDDSTVSQHVHDVRTKNAGGKQVQGKFTVFIHHGMPGVIPALIADDNVIIFGDQVDHAAFPFITPVHSNDSTDCHSSSKNNLVQVTA